MIYLISAFLALASAALESLSYIGFVHNHIGIRAYHLYLLSVILALSYKRSPSLVQVIMKILAIITSVIYLVLIFAETATYPNYVFSTTHINPFTFQLFLGLLWFHFLIIRKYNFTKSLLIAVIMFVAVDGMGRTLAIAYKGVSQFLRDPFATYAQKMTSTYPGFYPAMQEIKKLTPSDATIYIPPQGNPWEIEGNVAMVTYFLYPRKVINLEPDKIPTLPPKSYLLIAKGSWQRTGEVDYGWPKVDVTANQIWEIDTINNLVKNYPRDYHRELDKWNWGLIEVNNE